MGDQLVAVSNRLPITWNEVSQEWHLSAGGLAKSLHSSLSNHGGIWVGSLGGGSDDHPSDITHEGVRLASVAIDSDKYAVYYSEVSNGVLWPLLHDGLRSIDIRDEAWLSYVEANEEFARRAVAAADPDAMFWVHDYHLFLVPAMIRKLRPEARIGFFLHVPFPPTELFERLPWKSEILLGVLGSDVIGMHVSRYLDNFAAAVERHSLASTSKDQIHLANRTTKIIATPISVDVATIERLVGAESFASRVRDLRRQLGAVDKIIVGIDRMDYTKGIVPRLLAFEAALESGAIPPQTKLVQVAVPTRESVAGYEEERAEVERIVGRINGKFASLGSPAVHYVYRTLEVSELLELYAAADVMAVTPYRDGLNLVAKEFVAARVDESGVLLLSEFAGVAEEFKDAVLVNPYSMSDLVEGLATALRMSRSELQTRMKSLRATVHSHTLSDWTDTFVEQLAACDR